MENIIKTQLSAEDREQMLEHLVELMGSREEALKHIDDFANTLARENDEWLRTKYQRDRKNAYIESGVTIEALVVAQQEAAEGNSVELERLTAIREEIKKKFPKPEENE